MYTASRWAVGKRWWISHDQIGAAMVIGFGRGRVARLGVLLLLPPLAPSHVVVEADAACEAVVGSVVGDAAGSLMSVGASFVAVAVVVEATAAAAVVAYSGADVGVPRGSLTACGRLGIGMSGVNCTCINSRTW